MFREYNSIDRKCVQLLKDFKSGVEYGCYLYSDGYGYYATQSHVSDVIVDLEDIKKGKYPEWATHVCWFGK